LYRVTLVTQRLIFLLTVCIALFSTFRSSAQSDAMNGRDNLEADRGMIQIMLDDAAIAWHDGLAWFSAPLNYSQREWLFLTGTVAGTAATWTVDDDLRSFMQKYQRDDVYKASFHASEAGKLLWAQLLTGTLYLSGLALEHDELRVTGRMLGQSLGYAGLITQSMQILLGRDRPKAEKGPNSLNGWQWGNARQAIPSGHTTVTFAVASLLSRRIREPFVTVLLYTVATASGLALMYRDQHWGSDVLLGAIIGHTAGAFVHAREEQRSGRTAGRQSDGWSVFLAPAGAGLQYRF
jgi:membrane-associated phospholipid phosphatase